MVLSGTVFLCTERTVKEGQPSRENIRADKRASYHLKGHETAVAKAVCGIP